MTRIYEVKTEHVDGKPYDTYRVAAESFAEAVKKVQAKEIDAYKHLSTGERISEVRILASASR